MAEYIMGGILIIAFIANCIVTIWSAERYNHALRIYSHQMNRLREEIQIFNDNQLANKDAGNPEDK